MSTATHWTRRLKDGRVEFFIRAHGETMRGSASDSVYRELRERFEGWAGATLPEPEIKPSRGRS